MWEGYWAKDGSYVKTKPMERRNEVAEAKQREIEKARTQGYDEYEKRRKQAQLEAEQKRMAEIEHEQYERARSKREFLARDKEISRKVNMVNHWLKRNAFRTLVNKVNGKSRKFKNYKEELSHTYNIDQKEQIVERMMSSLGNKSMQQEAREDRNRRVENMGRGR